VSTDLFPRANSLPSRLRPHETTRYVTLIQPARSAAALAAFCPRRRCLAGEYPVIPRRVPGVDHKPPFICRAFTALFASSALHAAFAFTVNVGRWSSDRLRPSPLIPQPPAPHLRQPSVCQPAKQRSNSLYRDPPADENAPDEKKFFIGDGEPFGYHPQKGC